MFANSKTKSVVGLDIEAGSIAATELRTNGSPQLVGTATAPLDPGAFAEGEVVEPDSLAAALRTLFAEHRLSKTVRVGVANQRVAVRTVQVPRIDDKDELSAAVRFQAQEHVPMPLDDAVLDYQVVGSSNGEGPAQMSVVAVAARRDMVGHFLAALQGAGLKPVGLDLSAFAMIRALAPRGGDDGQGGATAYCHVGDATTIAVASAGACHFARTTPAGLEAIAHHLAERQGMAVAHAREWLSYVGLTRPTEEIEGDPETVSAARQALSEGATKLSNELRVSLEFYGSQEGALPVERVVVCGLGATIPGVCEELASGAGKDLTATSPQPLAHLGDPLAARLTLSYGLALEA